jgi:hypothetical protein
MYHKNVETVEQFWGFWYKTDIVCGVVRDYYCVVGLSCFNWKKCVCNFTLSLCYKGELNGLYEF